VPTWRLTFTYEDGSIKLLSRPRRVDMVAPASDPTEVEEAQTGFWYELRDGREHTLYRRTMQDLTDPTVEVRSGDPERPFMRKPAGALQRKFVVLVPDIGERPSLVFFGRPVPPGALAPVSGAAATEIARFDLR
jgi:hypothetical protein